MKWVPIQLKGIGNDPWLLIAEGVTECGDDQGREWLEAAVHGVQYADISLPIWFVSREAALEEIARLEAQARAEALTRVS